VTRPGPPPIHAEASYTQTVCGVRRTRRVQVGADEAGVTCRSCLASLRKADRHAQATMQRDAQPKRELLRSVDPRREPSPQGRRGGMWWPTC
jgi:hypothetical protein